MSIRHDWNNAVYAVQHGPFIQDLGQAVTNDADCDGAVRWLLALLGNDDPWFAFDTYVLFFEALDRTWPVMRIAAEMFQTDTPPIARFVADRIKAAGDEQVALPYIDREGRLRPGWTAPVTAINVIAERAHDLAAFFSIGLKPNGSKDPYALRRSAKHFIIASAMLPKQQSLTWAVLT